MFPEHSLLSSDKKDQRRNNNDNAANDDEEEQLTPQALRLRRFLEDDGKGKDIGTRKNEDKDTEKHRELQELRSELEILVSQEESLSVKERREVKGHKRKLLAEIAKLEAEMESIETEKLKGTFAFVFLVKHVLTSCVAGSYSVLPPPISPMEQKRLNRAVQLIDKARAGKERVQHKRAFDDFDMEDLDGEERLRLGKKLKVSKIQQQDSEDAKQTRFDTKEVVVSREMQVLLDIRRKRAELERKRMVEESEKIMREATDWGEDL